MREDMSILKRPSGQGWGMGGAIVLPIILLSGISCDVDGDSDFNPGGGGDFVPGDVTPTATGTPGSATPSLANADPCAPSLTLEEDDTVLVLREGNEVFPDCQSYLRLNFTYDLACDAELLGGRLAIEITEKVALPETPTPSATPTDSEETPDPNAPTPPSFEVVGDAEYLLFLENDNYLLDLKLDEAIIEVFIPVERFTVWDGAFTLTDSNFRSSYAAGFTNLPLESVDTEEATGSCAED